MDVKERPSNNRHSRANGNPVFFRLVFASMASYFLLLTPQEVTKKEGAPMSWPVAPLDRKQFLAVVDTQPPVADQFK